MKEGRAVAFLPGIMYTWAEGMTWFRRGRGWLRLHTVLSALHDNKAEKQQVPTTTTHWLLK
jgi:hypothetical protein